MARKGGKKRRASDIKENLAEIKTKKSNQVKVVLEEEDWMPVVATDFFKSEHFAIIAKQLTVIDENASFVGPFRKLKENSMQVGIDLIMLDRDVTDLPEMQTFMISTIGRYAFWRDTPSEKNPVIVFADLKTVPELSVVGNMIEHAVHHFCVQYSRYQDNPKEAKTANSNILDLLGDTKMKEESGRAIKNRKSLTVGGILGPGLYIDDRPNGKPRYRRLSNNLHDPHVENLLRCLNNVRLQQYIDTVVTLIDALMNDVMVYNDEGDFGNGLELGHVMFLANQKAIDDRMLSILIPAYKLLNRNDFVTILYHTMNLRDAKLTNKL